MYAINVYFISLFNDISGESGPQLKTLPEINQLKYIKIVSRKVPWVIMSDITFQEYRIRLNQVLISYYHSIYIESVLRKLSPTDTTVRKLFKSWQYVSSDRSTHYV